MLKQMSVGKKIGLGFVAVLVLMIVVGIAAYNGLNTASSGFAEYREMARDTNLAGRLQANMLMVRMNVKDFIITGSDKDLQQYQDYVEKMNGFLGEAQSEINDPERAAKIDFIDGSVKEYERAFEKVSEYKTERNHLVKDVLDVKGPQMEKALTAIMTTAERDMDAEAAYNAGMVLRNLMLMRLYVVKFLESNAQKDADRVESEFNELTANLTTLRSKLENAERVELAKQVDESSKEYHQVFKQLVNVIFQRNEIISGTLDRIGPEIAAAVEEVKLDIKAVQDDLGPKLAASNSRTKTAIIAIGIAALFIGMGLAFIITRGITKALTRIIDGLNEGADQVASASGQVSSSSQQLAEGASEQAAALEETSSSMEELSASTKQNADNSQEADSLMRDTGRIVDQANDSMSKLTVSMEEIINASQETSKIIKTIDEIAFQTNLLALNAAVEAARAGEAGAGFAVVADEVRNLAMRAAEAAKNTADLIEGTITKVNDGSDLVNATNEAFVKVAEGSGKMGELVAEIAASSKEQNEGIQQVSRAVTEMDKVVQQNAANAEESASASEEMNAQAEQMKDMVGELVAMVGGATRQSNVHRIEYTAGARAKAAMPEYKKTTTTPSSRATGKAVDPNQIIPLDDEFADF
jgi:methyl-accepting chemotaxis protein